MDDVCNRHLVQVFVGYKLALVMFSSGLELVDTTVGKLGGDG